MSLDDKTGAPRAFATRVIHAGQVPDPSTGALMPPIYANSTYLQQSPGVHKGLDYGRSHNPTRFALERCVADLEGGTQAFAFASGLAAISTVLELLDAGSHVVSGNDLYGGTFRLFDKVRQRSAGHRFSFVDLSDLAAFEASLQADTRMVWVETPSNPLLTLTDLAAIAAICRARGILCVADNTFASPWIQRPLESGFDVVVHSTTKYLNGHSDVIGGIAVVGQNPDLAERLGFLQNSVGAIAGPFDAFLTLRGVKTLALRMERHCSNALEKRAPSMCSSRPSSLQVVGDGPVHKGQGHGEVAANQDPRRTDHGHRARAVQLLEVRHHIIQRIALPDGLTMTADFGLQQKAVFNQIVTVEHLSHFDFQLVRPNVGQKTQTAAVDPQHRDVMAGQRTGRAQQTAITAHDNHHVTDFAEQFARGSLQAMTGQHLTDRVFKNHVHVPFKQEFFQSANRIEHLRTAQTTNDDDITKLLHEAPARFLKTRSVRCCPVMACKLPRANCSAKSVTW